MALSVVAAQCEAGGAWLVRQGISEHKGLDLDRRRRHRSRSVRGAGHPPVRRQAGILAAYGVYVAGAITWGMVADGYRPDRFDVIGALVCLAGMAVILFAPRGH
ncbi:YnfA family protein [Streptomyces luteocolor]|uniref:YnfA family protein n=1 Tax=Streptomyces luteocolor TaxID=285500 RepID=UPI0022A970AC|nr:YnfA family protein [Streptomyces luteocolor]